MHDTASDEKGDRYEVENRLRNSDSRENHVDSNGSQFESDGAFKVRKKTLPANHAQTNKLAHL